MTIDPITKQDLPQLAPLLAASFGDDFDLQDELDYFDKVPHDAWFYLSVDETPQGFIRYFDIGDAVVKLEWYVSPSPYQDEMMARLLEHFCKHQKLRSEARLRIDVNISQTQIIHLLKATFTTHHVKQFLYLSKSLTPSATSHQHLDESYLDTPPNITEMDLEHVADILSNLKSYSISELQRLYEDNKLHLRHLNDRPVAALHLEEAGAGVCEVITLATHPDDRRQGHANALLEAVLKLVAAQYHTVFLRVNEANTAALELYHCAGFKVQPEHTQQWWYVPVQHLRNAHLDVVVAHHE